VRRMKLWGAGSEYLEGARSTRGARTTSSGTSPAQFELDYIERLLKDY